MENSDYRKTEVVQRYVDILSDAGFKAVFGDQRNKDVLIDLLNVLLPAHRQIKSLTYDTTEIPGFTLSNKAVRLDLRCTSQDGTRFVVEFQCYPQDYFFKRAILYSSKVYDSGSHPGDDQAYDLTPVYFIGLVNNDRILPHKDVEMSPDKFICEYTFREKETMEVPFETIFLIFVELHRFHKELSDCHSLLDKWCYVLKYIGKLNGLPGSLQQKVFERFFKACEIAKFTPEQKLSYEADMITERDQINIKKTCIRIGREEGRVEGKEEKAREIAAKLKAGGIPLAQIIQYTGLTEEQIAAL